jgi:isoquinoline 1-oxidoreductase subunit beta
VQVPGMRGIIKVVNFWVVMDSGFSVQPRHLIAEVEGSIIYGLGHVLREDITIKGGHVQQSNFTDYEPLRIEETSRENPPIGGGRERARLQRLRLETPS